MNEQSNKTVTVNDIELSEGDTLWRYAALRTWQTTISEQDPDDVLRETAEALVDHDPDEYGDDPEVVHADLRANPGIYDDNEDVRYHAMEVVQLNHGDGWASVEIKDLKEQKIYTFKTERDDVEKAGFTNFEPMGALEEHLGVTILPVEDDNE